jgi:hypothetical protein
MLQVAIGKWRARAGNAEQSEPEHPSRAPQIAGSPPQNCFEPDRVYRLRREAAHDREVLQALDAVHGSDVTGRIPACRTK